MPLDRFSGQFVVKARDQIRDEWLVDYKFRSPDADVSQNTDPWNIGSAAADMAMPLYYDVKKIGSVVDIDNATGIELDIAGNAEGVPRLPESTAQGYVQAVASVGGGAVLTGQELRYGPTRAKYQALVSKSLSGTDLTFAIASISTGTGVNLPAGAKLEFVNPPVGLSSTVTVIGDGIEGGGPAESDPSYLARIKENRANPAAAANWAHYLKKVESLVTVNVEKGFAFPAILGSGTIGIVFTTKPSAPGGSRIPNGAQIATVEAGLTDDDGMPVDDGQLVGTIGNHDVPIALRVEWDAEAPGWVDAAPWPPSSSPAITVSNAVTIGATTFRVVATGSTTTPVAGKTIAVWDKVGKKMVAKRITAVTVVVANTTWDLTLDSSSPTSDAVYVPASGQRVSPWADSANDVAALVLAYVDRQGPGEQVVSLPDPNGRRRRHPIHGWPSVITNRVLDEVLDLDTLVADAEVLEPSLPFPTTVGSPGVIAYLHRLSDLSMFSEE